MGAADSKHRPRPLRHPGLVERPSAPGKPLLVPSDKHSSEPDVVTIRWLPPLYDGGSRISGYLVEHRRTGSPHWVRSSPALARHPELTLSGLEPGWRYQFRVSAQNAAGFSDPGELSDLLTVTLQRTVASAPFFIKELTDTVALENEKAELQVQVRGTPTPTMAWFKDGVEVFSSRSYRVVTDDETSTLVIHQAALSDEGEIKCSATNKVGYAVTRARLTLEAPPSIRLPRQYEEGLLFEKDEVIRLKVSVAGRPEPQVSWLLNGEPVPGGGRFEAGHAERYATLRVGEARRGDRGEYTVRAVNRLGEDLASFLVTVADRPMPPGRAKVVMTLGRSVTLSWTAPEDDGGCKIGNYIVEYYRLGWNMWLKAATCRQLTTTLGDLIEGSEYKFRAKAENPYGVSDPSPESDVVFIPDPKRGLLEPPEHGLADKEAMDVWLDDKKRPISPSPAIDDRYGERKTKKKRGPMMPPPRSPKSAVEREPGERHSMMSEDSMSPPATPEDFHPVIPKRRAKLDRKELEEEVEFKTKLDFRQNIQVLKRPKLGEGKDQQTQKDLEEDMQLQKKLGERRKIQELKRFEERKADDTSRLEERRDAEERHKVEELKKAEAFRKAGDSEEVAMKKAKTAGSQSARSMSVRSELHSSSELMLVLLPHSRAATEERETSKRELFESSMALEGDVAPPMSLSAPELGSGEPPEPLLRSAFSSTELLHDRAMARFYQDMRQEEEGRRPSLQRRRSFGSRGRVVPQTAHSLQDVASAVLHETHVPKQAETVAPTDVTKKDQLDLPQPGSSRIVLPKKTVSRDSFDSIISTEDLHKKTMPKQQPSFEDMEDEDSSSDEYEHDVTDEGEEDEETEDVDEEVEEELEEEEEEEFSMDDKRGSFYTSESEEESRYSLDEDTYHPRDVNLKYNEDTMISEYEGRGPLILGAVSQESKDEPRRPQVLSVLYTQLGEVAPPSHDSGSDVKLKPILKRPSNGNDSVNNNGSLKVEHSEPKSNEEEPQSSQNSETPSAAESLTIQSEGKPRPSTSPEKKFEPNFSPVIPKPILKVREPSQERLTPSTQRRGVPLAVVEHELDLGSSRSIDEGSDFETSVRKKQVRIEEPDEAGVKSSTERKDKNVPAVKNNETSRERTGSLGDDAEATRVVIDHYSDLVAEVSRARRAPRARPRYLDLEALKAAAEKEIESSPEIPNIVVNEPEPETTVELEIVKPEMDETQQKHEEYIPEKQIEEFKTEKVFTPEPILEEHKPRSFEALSESLIEIDLPIKKRSSSPRKKKRTPSPAVRKHSIILEDTEVPPPPPAKTEMIARTPSPLLPPRLATPTERRVQTYCDFLMDVSLFLLACWLYLFKDERLAIPVMVLMVYRQAREAFQRKMEAIRRKASRLLFWRKQTAE